MTILEKGVPNPIRTVGNVINDHNSLRIYYNTETDNDYHYVSFDGAGLFSGGVKKFPILQPAEHKCENGKFK